jgi:hypothetical protein
MKVSCVKTIRVAAPCSQCGSWPAAVHITSPHLKLLCEVCCPVCSANCTAARAETTEAQA